MDAYERGAWEKLFQRLEVLEPDRDVTWRYGGVYGCLQDQRRAPARPTRRWSPESMVFA